MSHTTAHLNSQFICTKKQFFACFVRSSSLGSHSFKTLSYSNSCVSLQLNVPVTMETRSLCGRSLREVYSWHRVSSGQKETKLDTFVPVPPLSSPDSRTRTWNAVYSPGSVGKLMQCRQKERLRQLPTRSCFPPGFQKQHPRSHFILFTYKKNSLSFYNRDILLARLLRVAALKNSS